MKRNRISVLALLLSFVLVLGIALPATVKAEEVEEPVKELIILHTNDVHGHAHADEKHIGYANYRNVIDSVKAENPNVLVVDAGDASQGTTFASLNEGRDVITILNMLPLDVFVPGNHEFDYSQESALANRDASHFPWYASNVFYEESGELVFKAGEVITVGDMQVGIFGLATPETKYKADPRNTVGMEFPDTVEANAQIAADEVAKLKAAGAEVIVMMSHLGTDKSSEVKSCDIAEAVEGIDVIIDGHSHSLYEEGLAVGHSFIASTGSELKNIGYTTVSTDGTVTSRMIGKDEAVPYGENQEIADLIAAIDEEQSDKLDVVIGKTKTLLEGTRELVRTQETNLADLITDAMLKASGADLVITNGGGIRDSIEAGEITYGDVFSVLPFGNAMTVIKVTGQDVIDALTHGTIDYPEPAGQFSQVAGVSYTIVPAQDEESENYVEDVMVQGKPVDPEAEYLLATNDFMAVGGDNYTMFTGKEQVALYGSLADIVVDYITNLTEEADEEGFVYEADGRISVKVEEEPEPTEPEPTTEPEPSEEPEPTEPEPSEEPEPTEPEPSEEPEPTEPEPSEEPEPTEADDLPKTGESSNRMIATFLVVLALIGAALAVNSSNKYAHDKENK